MAWRVGAIWRCDAMACHAMGCLRQPAEQVQRVQAAVDVEVVLRVPPLVEALGHAQGEERWQVTRALVELGRLHGEVFPVLVALVEGDASPRVRRMALFALRALAPDRPESARVILEASRSPDVTLRRVALSACAGLATPPENIPERLAEVLQCDPDPASRRCAAAALRSLATDPQLPETAVDALERAAAGADEDDSVREHAARALDNFGRGETDQALASQNTRASNDRGPGPSRKKTTQITARLRVYSAPGGSLVIK